MKDKRNLHLKVQELCDCYATSDPLKGMSLLKEVGLALGVRDSRQELHVKVKREDGREAVILELTK